MSVPEPRRDLSGVQFLDTAADLAEFTYKRCKKFPNRWGHEIRDKMEEMAMDVLTNAKRGNSVYVKTAEDAKLRRRFMMTAYASVQALVSQIELAEALFPLCGYLNHAADGSKKRNELSPDELKKLETKEKKRSREIMEQWSALAFKEEGLLKDIITSDFERFSRLK